MSILFTDRAKEVLQLADQEAQRLNDDYVGTEHILLGLIREGRGVAVNALQSLAVDPRTIPLDVEKLLPRNSAKTTVTQLPKTPRAKKVIEYAIEEAQDLGDKDVGTQHILVGMLRVQESIATRVLTNLGLKLENMRTAIQAVSQQTEHEGTSLK